MHLQVGFVAFITCTLFLRTRLSPTDENNGNLYLSSLFFSLVHMMFNGFSEMPILIERLPIFYKQRDNNFYPAWAFSIPSWILRIPYSIVEAIIWSCVVYYTVGLDPDVGRWVWIIFFDYVSWAYQVSTTQLYVMFLVLFNLAEHLQVFSVYAFAIHYTSNGHWSFPFDWFPCTKHDCCKHIWHIWTLTRVLAWWFYTL